MVVNFKTICAGPFILFLTGVPGMPGSPFLPGRPPPDRTEPGSPWNIRKGPWTGAHTQTYITHLLKWVKRIVRNPHWTHPFTPIPLWTFRASQTGFTLEQWKTTWEVLNLVSMCPLNNSALSLHGLLTLSPLLPGRPCEPCRTQTQWSLYVWKHRNSSIRYLV